MKPTSIPAERLPTFVIGGARKAGTTSLWSYLRTHPDIGMAIVKEPQFFTRQQGRVDSGNDFGPPRSGTFDRGWETYAEIFRGTEDRAARGEASTMYLDAPDSAELIRATMPDMKLIFCLRNPVDRIYSHYWFERQAERLPEFSEMARARHRRFDWYVHQSHYSQHLERYFDHFDRSRIHLVVAEDLYASTRPTVEEACVFVGVDPHLLPEDELEPKNEGATSRSVGVQRLLTQHKREWTRYVPRFLRPFARSAISWLVEKNRRPFNYPPMDPDVRAALLDEFENEVDGMEKILQRDLSLWRE